jgi:hypothetical protein
LAKLICNESGIGFRDLIDSGALLEWCDEIFTKRPSTPLKIWAGMRDNLSVIIAPASQSEPENETVTKLVTKLVDWGYTDCKREVQFTDLDGKSRRIDLEVRINMNGTLDGPLHKLFWIEAKGQDREYLDDVECERIESYAKYCQKNDIDFVLYAPGLKLDQTYEALIRNRVQILDSTTKVIEYLESNRDKRDRFMEALEHHIQMRAIVRANELHRETLQAFADHRRKRIAFAAFVLTAHAAACALIAHYLAI